jgi:hypothetical protein
MDVIPSYLRARLIVLIAAAMVAVSGGFIVRAFTRHISTPCQGTLDEVSLQELTPKDRRPEEAAPSELKLAWDHGENTYNAMNPKAFTNVRVEWERTDGKCACNTIALPWKSYTKNESVLTPSNLGIYRDVETGLFVVHDNGFKTKPDIVAFRKTQLGGTALKKGSIVQPNNIGMAILFGAFGALAAALYALGRARPYAQRISNWKSGVLRPDGIVESATGSTLGKLATRVRLLDGDVLVRPEVYEGRDVYREMPMFDKGDIAIGNHEFWKRGTYRRLADARTLAILATATTAIAMLANQFAG